MAVVVIVELLMCLSCEIHHGVVLFEYIVYLCIRWVVYFRTQTITKTQSSIHSQHRMLINFHKACFQLSKVEVILLWHQFSGVLTITIRFWISNITIRIVL